MKSNKPILVVDDDPDIRESIASALEIEGYPVLMAENGKLHSIYFSRLIKVSFLVLLCSIS